jgi:hypothetical protein
MTEPRIQLLDDLATEFARVAELHEHKPHKRRFPRMVGSPARTVAIVASALLLVVGGAYAVPPTRAAIDDLTASFAGWVAGDDEQAPGTPLAPGNDAPDWVREQGGRLIAEQNGVELYVTRVDTAETGTLLNFTIGDGVAIGGTIDDWRERFDDQAVVVLGAANFGSFRDTLDEHGRFPLLGVTARSVDRVELRYAQGPPLSVTDVDGGFVILADAARPLTELVAFDAAGRELGRVDVSHIDLSYRCQQEPGCSTP